MTPEEQVRAGRAVQQRMADLSCTVAEVSAKAGIDPKTLRALIAGRTNARPKTLHAVAAALDWPPGEIMRRASGSRGPLDAFTVSQLLDELGERFQRLIGPW